MTEQQEKKNSYRVITLLFGCGIVGYLILFIFGSIGWQFLGYSKKNPSVDISNASALNFNFNSFNSHSSFSDYIHSIIAVGTNKSVVDDILLNQGNASKETINTPELKSENSYVVRYTYRSFKSAALSLVSMMPNDGWLVSITYSHDDTVKKIVARGAP